jgi:hypothetical protein
MARDKTVYTCTACGGTNPKWLGKCPHCGEWNTLEETVAEGNGAPRHRYKALAPTLPVATLSQIEASEIERAPTGLAELDRPLGGGIVEGGVVLIGGDPGSANRRCCCRPPSGCRRRCRCCTSPARNRARRSRCARAASGCARHRCACWPKSSSSASWLRSRWRSRAFA